MDRQEVLHLPDLFLHQHQHADITGVQSFSAESAEPAAAAQSLRRLRVVHTKSSASLETEDGTFKLPLLLARINLGEDAIRERPVLAVWPHRALSPWYVLVDGTDRQVDLVLSLFGQAGAIRTDFHDCYQIESHPLGRGSVGVVHAIAPRRGHQEETALVAKVQKSDGVVDMHKELTMTVLAQGHPNVVRLMGMFEGEDGTHKALVMERCAQGGLPGWLQRNVVTDCQRLSIIVGLLSALSHVHARGIVHRDVKPDNVLVSESGTPVLADFGMACSAAMCRKRCGSPGYVAPEVIQGYDYGSLADCFSAGCVWYFLHVGRSPFSADGTQDTLQRTVSKPVQLGVQFEAFSPGCKDLLLRLLHKSAGKRPTAEGALGHSCFTRPGQGDEQESQEDGSGPLFETSTKKIPENTSRASPLWAVLPRMARRGRTSKSCTATKSCTAAKGKGRLDWLSCRGASGLLGKRTCTAKVCPDANLIPVVPC